MKNLYRELAEYTGRNPTLVEARCQIANVEQAWRWELLYKDDPIKGYREDDLYIFDLTFYQMRLQKNGIHDWYRNLIRKHGWKTGLDLGGGIGEQTIIAMEEDVDMTFCEVKDSKTLEYAKWRFDRWLTYGTKPKIVFEDYKIDRNFDFVVAMDVFEHMVDPKPAIKAVAEHTKYLFCNPDQIQFNWLYPQHISKFSIGNYFINEDIYLWRKPFPYA